jgi:rfaE bifunctional protein kinase chain/domain
MNFEQLFLSFQEMPVAVVGDVMLDTYWWGKTDRISPEAPVPVVAFEKKEYRIGGAGNVALNLVALGSAVSMHTVGGDDDDGRLLCTMMEEKGIDTAGVMPNIARITTNKIRIMSRSQQMMRLDKEMSTDINTDLEEHFVQQTITCWEKLKPRIVIFEDYNKGVLTTRVIADLIAWCKAQNVLTAVDPKRRNFFAYRKVDIFKPNLKEAREALNLVELEPGLNGMQQVHRQLLHQLGHRISLVTLSEHGAFYQVGEDAAILPAHVRNIADVSGAGDTVIAVASLVYASTRNARLMAEIANIAGGLVCEEVGTAAIDANKLLAECQALLGGG